jgi:hypothetical protein
MLTCKKGSLPRVYPTTRLHRAIMYCNCTKTEPNTVALSSSEDVDEPLKQADTSSDKDELEPAQTNYELEGRRFESCRARP